MKPLNFTLIAAVALAMSSSAIAQDLPNGESREGQSYYNKIDHQKVMNPDGKGNCCDKKVAHKSPCISIIHIIGYGILTIITSTISL